jgi:hypothetical protein
MGDVNCVELKSSGDTLLLRVDIELYESLVALQKLIKDEYSEEKHQRTPYIVKILSETENPCWIEQMDDYRYSYNEDHYSHDELLEIYKEENDIIDCDTDLYYGDFKVFIDGECEKIPIKKEKQFENEIFITRKSAEEYIKYNSHHIVGENPVTYATCASGDLNKLLELFIKLEL